MALDVFISYSSKDKPIADAVCANIEAAVIRCWIAPRDIAPGEDWPTAITRAISNSRIMVLIFSSNSNSSEDVGRELMLAATSKLVIIPFKIENIEPEPGKQYYLARTHWLDAVNPPTQEQISILVHRVQSILPATSPVPTIQAEPVPEQVSALPLKPSPKRPQPRWWLVWLAGILVILGGITWIIFGGVLEQVPATLVPTMTLRILSTPTASEVVPIPPDISNLGGTWTGTVANGDFQMQITITIFSNCETGQVCAHFYNATLPCSGDFAFDKLINGMFEFTSTNKQGNCGPAQDYLQAQPDGTLLHLSQGDFGETRGYLQKSDNPEFSADFNDPSFNGKFNPDEWFISPDISLTSIQQVDGAMVFSKQSTPGTENGNLKTIQFWSLGKVRYLEARLRLDQEHSGDNGNLALTFWDTEAWWTGCGIQPGGVIAYFWCGQGSAQGNDFWSDWYVVKYDQWYTVQVKFDPQTNKINYYLDGFLFYSLPPANIDEILEKKLLITIGIWASDGTSITGYVDDVRIVK